MKKFWPLVLVAIAAIWWLLWKKAPAAYAATAGSGASGSTTADAKKPAIAFQGVVANFLKQPPLAQGSTVQDAANPNIVQRVKTGQATINDFLALPLGYLAEVLLSYTQQQAGAPGAPDGDYVPEGPMAQAAVNAMHQLVPQYNTPGGIDGYDAKITYLTSLIQRSGRPKIWGINA